MTRKEALEYKARWQMINRITAAESRQLSLEDKLMRLAALYSFSQTLPSTQRDETTSARDVWNRLKELSNV